VKALVIGAAGQVGGALIQALHDRGHQAIGVDRVALCCSILQLDASNALRMHALLKETMPDWVFYPAGFSWVDGCERDPLSSFNSNVKWPLGIATVVGQLGAGFTYYSSEYIFDGRHGPYAEEAEPNPLNIYGRHKLEAEQKLPRVGRTLLVRTTVVYGQEIQRKNFVYQVLDRLSRNETMLVPNDQISSPTYNVDLAQACVECAERGILGTLNLAGPDRIDRYAFALRICETFDLEPALLLPTSTSVLGQTAMRPLNAGLDSSKACQLLQTRLRGVWKGLEDMKDTLAHRSLDNAA